MDKTLPSENGYSVWLKELKSRIRQSQIKASVRVNTSMLELYWSIGADIVTRQAESVWGAGILKRLSRDLRAEFPDTQGFSERNLWYMKKFFLFYSQEGEILHQLGAGMPDGEIASPGLSIARQDGAVAKFPHKLALVPWRHQVEIISRCKSLAEALFYVSKTVENGWSRAMLLNFLDTGLYGRQGKAVNNFRRLLPEPQSDLAEELMKDPYQFDFIALTEGYKEKELEDALTSNITKFLLELGQGFAYVGRQMPLLVGEKEFFVDLLFYHLELRCYVVIELKTGEFKPEDTGQLSFYVSAVNHQKKKAHDNQTVGLLICRTKDNIVAQYSLESSTQPIGISEYELVGLLPEDYKSALPSVEEIEAELKAREF
jgi:predicted nuclease of restriction endonuclease-like (RecB) superfamily